MLMLIGNLLILVADSNQNVILEAMALGFITDNHQEAEALRNVPPLYVGCRRRTCRDVLLQKGMHVGLLKCALLYTKMILLSC